MIDAEKILLDLRDQAEALARDFDVDAKMEQAKEAAGKVRERLETDPKARNVAAGAGGLLLLSLLGTRGGRRLIGDVAQTGAVAAIGALAYKAWNDRRGGNDERPPPDFLADVKDDPDFALAIIRAMLATAFSDGVLDAAERQRVLDVIKQSGGNQETLALLMDSRNEAEDLDKIVSAATTPNRAAQLYTAAAMTADFDKSADAKFLEKLAERLGIAPDFVEAIKSR